MSFASPCNHLNLTRPPIKGHLGTEGLSMIALCLLAVGLPATTVVPPTYSQTQPCGRAQGGCVLYGHPVPHPGTLWVPRMVSDVRVQKKVCFWSIGMFSSDPHAHCWYLGIITFNSLLKFFLFFVLKDYF